MRALESVTGVLDVAVFGGGLHVTVDDVEATMRAHSRRRWRRRASKCSGWSRSSPRMEDVFVAMIEAEERKAA